MKVSSPDGMNLDVHAAQTYWRRTADTLKTQCERTEALSVHRSRRGTLGAESSAQNYRCRNR